MVPITASVYLIDERTGTPSTLICAIKSLGFDASCTKFEILPEISKLKVVDPIFCFTYLNVVGLIIFNECDRPIVVSVAV